MLQQHHVANRIVEAHDGVEALDYSFGTGTPAGRDLRQQPQVVLLDLKLPRIDGLEVLHRLRADPRTRLQPVVILTSSKEEKDVVAGYALGANSYVRKPVDFTEFSARISELVVVPYPAEQASRLDFPALRRNSYGPAPVLSS